MNQDLWLAYLQYQDIAKNLTKGQFTQNLKLMNIYKHVQITFVMLNRFCLLSKNSLHSLFLTDNIRLDKIPTQGWN